MPSASTVFEIPNFYYFESENNYSGSKGNFAYKIEIGERFRVMVWHGRLCSDKAKIEDEANFDFTQEGFEQMIKWLDNAYDGDRS